MFLNDSGYQYLPLLLPVFSHTHTHTLSLFQAMCVYIFLIAITSMISGISGECTPGRQLENGVCKSCPAGHFKTATSDTKKCEPHTRCPAGTFTKSSGQPFAQPKCDTCPTGRFKADVDITSLCKGQDSGKLNDCGLC